MALWSPRFAWKNQRKEPAMSEFKREERFIVIKRNIFLPKAEPMTR